MTDEEVLLWVKKGGSGSKKAGWVPRNALAPCVPCAPPAPVRHGWTIVAPSDMGRIPIRISRLTLTKERKSSPGSPCALPCALPALCCAPPRAVTLSPC